MGSRRRYAGIGSRKTPGITLHEMTRLACWLAEREWHLVSGGAKGADHAFFKGSPLNMCTLYLPWFGYNEHKGNYCIVFSPGEMSACMEIAARLHPAWNRCGKGARKMHARNAAILLGPALNTPVDAVIAWTPQGKITGGTGMGLRIAEEYGIPIFNFGTMELVDIQAGMLGIMEQQHV